MSEIDVRIGLIEERIRDLANHLQIEEPAAEAIALQVNTPALRLARANDRARLLVAALADPEERIAALMLISSQTAQPETEEEVASDVAYLEDIVRTLYETAPENAIVSRIFKVEEKLYYLAGMVDLNLDSSASPDLPGRILRSCYNFCDLLALVVGDESPKAAPVDLSTPEAMASAMDRLESSLDQVISIAKIPYH